MFINIFDKPKFKKLNSHRLILFLLSLLSLSMQGQQAIRGLVTDLDSASIMPFVYIISKNRGSGTMSDHEGRFSMMTAPDDTLICSYVGYLKSYIPVKSLRKNAKGEVKLIMVPMYINLNAVTVSTFRIKPYEREYMNNIIEQSIIRDIDYFRSPISALYMQYSKEGRQVRKLARIFENLIIEEQVQKKLSREILVRLTGDENIDYVGFRRYCYYVNDYFFISHDGVDLYSKVMECYKRWKSEGRNEPPKRKEE